MLGKIESSIEIAKVLKENLYRMVLEENPKELREQTANKKESNNNNRNNSNNNNDSMEYGFDTIFKGFLAGGTPGRTYLGGRISQSLFDLRTPVPRRRNISSISNNDFSTGNTDSR